MLPPNYRNGSEEKSCENCFWRRGLYCERFPNPIETAKVCDGWDAVQIADFTEVYQEAAATATAEDMVDSAPLLTQPAVEIGSEANPTVVAAVAESKKKKLTEQKAQISQADLTYLKDYAKRTGKSASGLVNEFEAILSGTLEEFDWDKASVATTQLKPPQYMVNAAKKGLRLYEEGKNGSGLVPNTVAWARRIVAGSHFSPSKIRKAYSFIKRHNEASRKPGWDTAGEETPGYVAMLLWFNDTDNRGLAWFERKRDDLEEQGV